MTYFKGTNIKPHNNHHTDAIATRQTLGQSRIMPFTAIAYISIFSLIFVAIFAFDCLVLLQDPEVNRINWPTLQFCLAETNSENVFRNSSANIWRLVKIAFDGIENIPPSVYSQITFVLSVISVDEIRNISMTQVELVEAFGSSYKSGSNFNAKQLKIIAQKVRNEWVGKHPKTYSEYDLISMGEILCHLNVSDIQQLHAVAFKLAVQRIGTIENCPQTQLQALAQLAKSEDAFGMPKDWTKIDVSIIGNIINGLSRADIATMDKDKLLLNRFYKQKHGKQQQTMKTRNQTTNKSDNKF